MRDQLNKLVISYQNGETAALDEIYKKVSPIIERNSKSIWYKVKNFTDFECRCILKIKKALTNFDPNKGDFISLIYDIITNEKSDFLKRRSSNYLKSTSLEVLADSGGVEGHEDFESLNALAGVDEEIIFNEKIALLAKGDQRRLAVLKLWSKGYYNDSDIANTLASIFGGKSETHRTFIKRFRTECQTTAATII